MSTHACDIVISYSNAGHGGLFYAPNGRTLAIVEDHAALITRIFEHYLALGNVRLVEAELAKDGVRNPVRQRSSGASFGDSALARGQLYTILANPIYIGRIPHRDRSYQGLHPAIISTGLWDEVQAKLADNRQGERTRVRAANPSLLAGKIVDASGNALIASHASKPGPSNADQAGRRFRYYVSQSLTAGPASAASAGVTSAGIRMPALEIETAVTQRIAEAFDDPFALAGRLEASLTPATPPPSPIGRRRPPRCCAGATARPPGALSTRSGSTLATLRSPALPARWLPRSGSRPPPAWRRRSPSSAR